LHAKRGSIEFAIPLRISGPSSNALLVVFRDRIPTNSVPDDDLLEAVCTENEKDGIHFKP
jgi:hypothetical protein